MANIVNRVISTVSDNRLSLLGESWARTMSGGNDFTKLIIGMRLSLNDYTERTNMARWYFGLTSGTSAPPGSATPNHFVGVTTQANPGWHVGSADCVEIGYTAKNTTSKIIAGTETITSTNAAPAQFIVGRASTKTVGMFFQFEKSTNWTLNCYCTPVTDNCDLATFLTYMNVSTIVGAGTLVSVLATAAKTISVDEATNGNLDTICISWPSEVAALEISDVAWAKVT